MRTLETRLHRRTQIGVDYSYPVTVTYEINEYDDPEEISACIEHRTGDVWLELDAADLAQLTKVIRSERLSDKYEYSADYYEFGY